MCEFSSLLVYNIMRAHSEAPKTLLNPNEHEKSALFHASDLPPSFHSSISPSVVRRHMHNVHSDMSQRYIHQGKAALLRSEQGDESNDREASDK